MDSSTEVGTELHPVVGAFQNPIISEKFDLAVRKLFLSQSYFCTIDIKAILGLVNKDLLEKEIREELGPLHCVSWSDMSNDMIRHIIQVSAVYAVHNAVTKRLNPGGYGEEILFVISKFEEALKPRSVVNPMYRSSITSNFNTHQAGEMSSTPPKRKLLSFFHRK